MPMVINSALYRNGKRERDLSVEDISDVLHTPGSFVWLGLHEPDNAMLKQVQEEFALHDLAIEDARNAHQRPKLEVYGDTLFIVLNTAQMEKEGLIVLSENDGRRKTYLLTNAGMEALRAEYSRLRAMVRDGAWIGEGGTNEKTQL